MIAMVNLAYIGAYYNNLSPVPEINTLWQCPKYDESPLLDEFYREQQTITNRLQTEYDILQESVWAIRKRLSEDSTGDKEWHILKDELDRVETRRIRIEEQMRTGELE